MDELIFKALHRYYHALEYLGYVPYKELQKLLVLIFYRDLLFEDYRGHLSKHDYQLVDQALYCLYGSSCLIPYPDYLKNKKMRLGDITEMAHRLKALENTEVIKMVEDVNGTDSESDILITVEKDT